MDDQIFVKENNNLLTLLIDRKGIFSNSICQKLQKDMTTVVVSAGEIKAETHIIPVSYKNTIPEIPEGHYSHIFFIWDGKKESLHILPPLLEKAASEKAQLLFITDYHMYTPELWTVMQREYSQSSLLLLGDVFGNKNYETIVESLIQNARNKRRIQLEGVGLKTVYPVSYDDTIDEILHIGFGVEKGKIFLATQPHGVTELSIAHAIQKIDPLIIIDFQKEELPEINLPIGKHLLGNENSFLKKLHIYYQKQVPNEDKTSEPTRVFSSLTFQKQKHKKKTKKPYKILYALLIFVILFSPVIGTLLYAGFGAVLVYAALQTAKAGNFSQAATFSQTGENLFVLSGQTNTFAEKELSILFMKPAGKYITQKIADGKLFASLSTDGSTALEHFSLVTKGKTISPYGEFLLGVNSLQNALVTLGSARTQAGVEGVPLSRFASLLAPWTSVLDISPSLFGFPSKKNYLVLFQNNMELRPGGGFIGSYGVLTVDKGVITDFTIHNVYDADGQLKGHVEPPAILRRFVQVHWYLRDSNFDVDFSQDAANAAFFLKQETGQTVDGVIGVDLNFVQALLTTIGPVYVPEYKQTVNDKNFFLLTETHVEKNSFAGSTQKQDFLKAVFSAMQNKLQTPRTFSIKGLVALLTAVKEKDVVFGFSNPLVQDVFTVNGFSSTLWDGRKQEGNSINDFTGLNEANLGINKANYFVTRSVEQKTAITNTGSVSGSLAIQYKNSSKKDQWPGGIYKNYLRVILPYGASLTGIYFDAKEQHIIPAINDPSIYEAKNFIAPQGLEVARSDEGGKTIYGFFVNVAEGEDKTVSIQYVLSQKLDITQPTATYNGLLFKQPGIGSYPYTFTLQYPKTYTILEKPQWASAGESVITFHKTFSEDTPFIISLTKSN